MKRLHTLSRLSNWNFSRQRIEPMTLKRMFKVRCPSTEKRKGMDKLPGIWTWKDIWKSTSASGKERTTYNRNRGQRRGQATFTYRAQCKKHLYY